jgi:hypothetical protein
MMIRKHVLELAREKCDPKEKQQNLCITIGNVPEVNKRKKIEPLAPSKTSKIPKEITLP